MSRLTMAIIVLAALATATIAGCAKGRYTDDGHYVGNPERLPATSEPVEAIGSTGVSASGTKEPPPAVPTRP